MKQLMLTTADSGKATYEEVIKQIVPMRQTMTYQPIQNQELLNMLGNVAEDFGLELVNPEFGLARAGQRMFGVYEVKGHDHYDSQVKMMLGVRNSFDGSLSAGICFGSKVLVCSNLAFAGYAGEDGEVGNISHKHTVNIEDTLYRRLRDSLSQFHSFKEFQDKFYHNLSDVEINNDIAYSTIVRAVMADAIPNKDVVRVARSWKTSGRLPETDNEKSTFHPEFISRNAYSLFNVFTENHKHYTEKNPVEANKRSIKLTRLFHSQFSN